MTRKRVVKLVMGRGHCRNYANYVANVCLEKSVPYEKLWAEIVAYEGPLGRELFVANVICYAGNRRREKYICRNPQWLFK